MADVSARLERARLYLVTDAAPGERALRRALAGGVDVLQLREKEASDEEILAAAVLFRRLCDEGGALFVLNDRPDLALAAGADAVHVGQGDEPVAGVREAVGDRLAIGLSTHSDAQLAEGLATDADYVCVGPVFPTPTKPDYRPVGLDLVRRAAESADRPWFAIGGIDRSNAREVAAAGAERIVVVRAVRDADDPEIAARELRAALDRTAGRVE